jgi:hypothetical protein
VVAALAPLLTRLSEHTRMNGPLPLEWDRWRPEFERVGLPPFGDEAYAYTVFDRHGRAWTIQFTHFQRRLGAIPPPVRAQLDTLIGEHQDRHVAHTRHTRQTRLGRAQTDRRALVEPIHAALAEFRVAHSGWAGHDAQPRGPRGGTGLGWPPSGCWPDRGGSGHP